MNFIKLLKKLFAMRPIKKRTAKISLSCVFTQTHDKENCLSCACGSMHGKGLPPVAAPPAPPAAPHSPASLRLDLHRLWHPTAWALRSPYIRVKTLDPHPPSWPLPHPRPGPSISLRPRRPPPRSRMAGGRTSSSDAALRISSLSSSLRDSRFPSLPSCRRGPRLPSLPGRAGGGGGGVGRCPQPPGRTGGGGHGGWRP
jgi:hypothetical protein